MTAWTLPEGYRKGAVHVLHALIWLLVAWLLAKQILGHWNDLSAFSITVRPALLVAALVGILIHKGLYAYAWYVWIRPFQPSARPVASMASFFVSSLLNYLPGMVWPALWLARINQDGDSAADPRGRRAGTVMSYLQLQLLSIIAVALTLGFAAVLTSLHIPLWLRAGSIAVALAGALSLLPTVRERVLTLLARLLRRSQLAASRPGRLWPIVFLTVAGNFVAAAWLQALITAFFPSFHTSYVNVLFIGFASQFATHLAIGIPSGLGVRELTLTLLLQQDGLMTAPEALVTSVLVRAFVVIADVALPALFVYPWLRFRKR